MRHNFSLSHKLRSKKRGVAKVELQPLKETKFCLSACSMRHVLNSSANSFSARHGDMHPYAKHRRNVELHVHHQKPAPKCLAHDHLRSCRHARGVPESLR